MKISKLIEELKKYPQEANARAYEGEVCGIVIDEHWNGAGCRKYLGVIEAHESEPYWDAT